MTTKVYANVIKCSMCQAPLAYTDYPVVAGQAIPMDIVIVQPDGTPLPRDKAVHMDGGCFGYMIEVYPNTDAVPVL